MSYLVIKTNKKWAVARATYLNLNDETKKKIKVKERYLNYVVVVTDDNKTQIKKRDGSGIWKNLYEFPLIETETETSAKHISKELDLNFTNLLSVKRINHKLSHQLLHITFFVFKVAVYVDYVSHLILLQVLYCGMFLRLQLIFLYLLYSGILV